MSSILINLNKPEVTPLMADTPVVVVEPVVEDDPVIKSDPVVGDVIEE